MAFTVLAAVGIIVAAAVYTIVSGLQKNIAKARKTGLVYIVVPIDPINIVWQLTFFLWVPLIKLLPRSLWENWLFVMIPEWGYRTGQTHFDRLGAETFIVVSPTSLIMYTQSPEAIHQITQRRDAFPKEISRYEILDMFGKSVLTTEAGLWRVHRKVTSASFNEKNAAHTFAEAVNQTRGMLGMWFGGPDGERIGTTRTIKSLEHDTMTWALNIIGYVGFGLRLLWPGQTLPKDMDPKLAKYGSLDAPPGHSMTFADSVALTLERIVAILLFPDALLQLMPFKFAKEAYTAKRNYVRYMNEFLHEKVEETQSGQPRREGMDIMGQLVQSKYNNSPTPTKDKTTTTKDKTTTTKDSKLDDSDIIGNAFIMIVAGHETTANTLHFALVELANNPATQRRLQRDVDALLGEPDSDSISDPSAQRQWDYERVINPLLASHVGATVNETLRLMPPVTGIPKVVASDADQALTVDGRTHLLPAGMSITLLPVCVQRNPRWWPAAAGTSGEEKKNDMDEFLPERWYRSRDDDGSNNNNNNNNNNNRKDELAATAVEDKADYGGFQGSDVSASLYRPVRGSYLPFSDGPRSCLGRRIAMVEMAAALAVIFQRYSIELAVDEWVGDDAQVEAMGAAERRALYRRAQEKSRETLRLADSVLTLKLHGGRHVPVSYESYRKTDLELAIDEHLSENVSRYQMDPRFLDYFKSRARAGGSPVKKEALATLDMKPARRRAARVVEEIAAAVEPEDDNDEEAEEDEDESTSLTTQTAHAASDALARTPGRAMALASRLQLPATPAEVAQAVDRGALAVRARATSLYRDSGLGDAAQTTRAWLSTVHSVVSAIALFELYRLRQELLPDRYAFTVPAVRALGTPDYPVHLPDMFAVVTAGFWGPALTWALTSVLLPSLAGYFFNLSLGAAQQQAQSGGGRVVRSKAGGHPVAYAVDPVMFSIVKAVVTYVVYAQGVTLGGLINPDSVSRINSALYSGWKGVLVGTAVSGLTAVYDAVLRK
ncbi:cytochrome P450 [Parathielavia hyrcaniae]|uniref:Cytochrome P450 n=1 Tax=Parathielavia hyrcaniae TaxID=113614 RepID=A0AAN6T558_9PEZI|nr:cytochrome P450 [Parathielavia hyrcaniae]